MTTTLGRHGLSVRGYDIEHVRVLPGPRGQPAFGASPHDGGGRPLLGSRRRPLIQLSDLALTDRRTAIITIFHEIAHHRSFLAAGHGGSEYEAERFGERMYHRFARRLA
ncbi:hypothetical protein MXD59_12295 [Frankia sp. Ag45/Mut15]|uniref:SprT-like domain-containing protein n=1 Tax=Frankia umida TaxID=573489 RepID=A0ABT0JYH3_9ACTN|nr:hypothetical protein [Frankia umida]MCK9876546.1 hypothetical protein [Frankia umida]